MVTSQAAPVPIAAVPAATSADQHQRVQRRSPAARCATSPRQVSRSPASAASAAADDRRHAGQRHDPGQTVQDPLAHAAPFPIYHSGIAVAARASSRRRRSRPPARAARAPPSRREAAHAEPQPERRTTAPSVRPQRRGIERRQHRHIQRKAEARAPRRSRKTTCSPNHIARFRITPTTAAVIAASAPASAACRAAARCRRAEEDPEERRDEGHPGHQHRREHRRRPWIEPARVAEGREKADELHDHDQRPGRGLGHAEAVEHLAGRHPVRTCSAACAT